MKYVIKTSSVTASVMIVLTVLAAFVAFFIGYVMNIIWLVSNGSLSHVTVGLVLRLIGIFAAPIGSLMGWFGG